MAFQKIDVRKGEIFRNEKHLGRMRSHPPEGVRAQASVSSENDITSVRLQWKIKRPPQPTAPLELLKIDLETLAPQSMFIAGRRYGPSDSVSPPEHEKGFPYSTYYKFRVHAGEQYDAALHAKLPLICWREQDAAFSIVFPKFIRLSAGQWPLFIKPDGKAGLSIIMPNEFEVQRKRYGWFSTRSQTQKYGLSLSNVHLLEMTIALIAADSWPECVRKSSEWLHRGDEHVEPIPCESLANLLERSLNFYNRVWDGRNHTHVHLPLKNAPGFESIEFKYSHITDDIVKLVLYHRLARAGWKSLEAREKELLQKISEGDYTRDAGGAVWHTTTYFTGKGVRAFTHHGTGFVGFPGGMATNVRRLCEYAELAGDDAVTGLADSGAQWLLKARRGDGSWPAVLVEDEGEMPACIASTAESARALAAAHHRTHKPAYLDAARAAAAYMNRDESFFECRQYLRDVGPTEVDGISAEACIHANLDLFSVSSEKDFLDQAEKWGCYALQWVRPFFFDAQEGPSFDGLSRSITPRVDVWGGLLVARALMRLGRATNDRWWLGQAWHIFDGIVKLQEQSGGLCETWFFDFPDGLESVHFEPTFIADAFVEFILDACEEGQTAVLSEEISHREKNLRKRFPPLKPTAPIQSLIAISESQPEFIIERELKLVPVFCGPHTLGGRLRRLLYAALRPLPGGRRILKLVPAVKILLNLHQVSPPATSFSTADRVRAKSTRIENFGNGRQRFAYTMGFYKIVLSIQSAGFSEEGFLANDIDFDIETTTGDLRVKQVRIDLQGNYSVQSVARDEATVRARGAAYRMWITGGSLSGILQEENQLAFDISLSSNWNFFGKHHLSMRVERAG